MIWAALVFMALGLFFTAMANIGVLKLPDVYTRLHASSKCSATAIISIIAACAFMEGFSQMTLRILIIGFFFFVTSPVSSHIIGRRAWTRNLHPWRRQRQKPTGGESME